MEIQNRRKPYVAVPVGNNTKHAITLPRKTALGSIHPIEKVIDTDATDKHKTNVKVNSIAPPPNPNYTKQTLWQPPVDLSHLDEVQQEKVKKMLSEESAAFAQDSVCRC